MLLLLASLAQAQTSGGAVPEINGQLFRPSIDATSTLWTDESLMAPNKYSMGRFALHYVNDPVVYIDENQERRELVSGVWQLSLMGAHTRGPVRIGLDLPVYLRSTGEATGGETGLGDLATDVRVTALDRREKPIGLAVAGRLSLPTSTVAAPLGGSGVGWELGLIADKEIGENTLVAFNLGTKGVPNQSLENVEYKDQLFARAGVGHSLNDATGVGLDLASHFTYGAMDNPAGRPVEALASGWRRLGDEGNWVARGGVGTGLTAGIGAPRYRLVAAIAWEPPREVEEPPPPPPEPPPAPEPEGPPSGSLLVEAQDSAGKPVPTAVWSIRSAKLSEMPAGTTHELEVGEYTLVVEAPGYQPIKKNIAVYEGSEELVQLVLVPSQAEVKGERIDIRDSVYFETNKDLIKIESHPLLDDIAAILVAHEELTKIRIEGHTDSRGSDSFNKELSQRRAEAVKVYLVDKGVAAERLEAVGYGEEKPLDTSETAEAWEKNRRVDFFVIERSD